ncbi:unnamed protein product [Schistosoma margrebowiei]|uniref:Uncharacterized protein n=1 Tax=Schistosoma margrebowiei TaxID=48269 RepID=A0A183MKK1_9TREM|nr:unnamed protein product [Schistosoma margrebowiei]
MQIKTVSVAALCAPEGLKYNTGNNNALTHDGETLEAVEFFSYLRSFVDKTGVSDADVKAKIGKATTALLQL